MALSSPPTATSSRLRTGIVLGAGGVLGAAWMVGVLHALQDRLDRPLGEADTMVGTSAGSVLTAALRCGAHVRDLVVHQRGAPSTLPPLRDIDRQARLVPPRLRLGSPHLIARAAMVPHRVHPRVAASGLLPEGRGKLRAVGSFVEALQGHAARHGAGMAAWPARDTWIVAVDYESGQRAVFGRSGTPAASLADAVVASCSIPGWYEPKMIARRRYVDGAVHSAASIDLLAHAKLDRVYVLAPMASTNTDRPRHPALRAERFLRTCIAGWLEHEAAKVEASGTQVTLLTPGPEDLAVMGINLMDATRRHHVLETALRTAPDRLALLEKRRAGRR